MGFVTIEDLSGSVEVTVFSDIYTTAVGLLKSDDPLLITGKLEHGEKGCQDPGARPEGGGQRVAAETARTGRRDQAAHRSPHARPPKRSCFNLRLDDIPSAGHMSALKEIMERHRGDVPAFIQFVIPQRSRSIMPLPAEMSVAASDELRLEVERLFGYNAATFE